MGAVYIHIYIYVYILYIYAYGVPRALGVYIYTDLDVYYAASTRTEERVSQVPVPALLRPCARATHVRVAIRSANRVPYDISILFS